VVFITHYNLKDSGDDNSKLQRKVTKSCNFKFIYRVEKKSLHIPVRPGRSLQFIWNQID